jgi:hypothetical protein
VINPSFESGFANWSTVGYPLWVDGFAIDGTHSMLLGDYDNAEDLLVQFINVPSWAETAAVYASWYMTSTDTPYYPTDALQISVFDSGANFLEDYFVWNTSTRNQWFYTRQTVPNISAYRNTTISVTLGAITDSSLPTGWYVDKIWLVFACGSTPASDYVASSLSNESTDAPDFRRDLAREQALKADIANSERRLMALSER